MAGTSVSAEGSINPSDQTPDPLKQLYPAVNEEETSLPRSWSPKDKFNFIGLAQNNLRVHYKGLGKTHKDAASVRATHPIPVSCGIYYFEVKIISKGRDGYMGIGLSVQGVNLNRLPGWDKHSYGYHGDDGHSFCSSGTGQPYGPTFSTGDVIGCCVNMIDNTCFYTKNGVSLGIAFRDLPANLYPTVGLQTPGEIVEANFGYSPFVFDIEDYMRQEWKLKTQHTIEMFPVEDRRGEWQAIMQKIVTTYLVHHGYCATAESFARSTGQSFEEELASIKNRQRIQRLVLAGRVGEAIDTTQQLYPGLLERNPNLLFNLKCRQFIEMVNGTDSEVRGPSMRSPRSHTSSARSSPSMSPVHYHHQPQGSSMGQRSESVPHPPSGLLLQSSFSANKPASSSASDSSSPHIIPPMPPASSSSTSNTTNTAPSSTTTSKAHTPADSSASSSSSASTSASSSASSTPTGQPQPPQDATMLNEEVMNKVNSAMNGSQQPSASVGNSKSGPGTSDSDVDMDTCESAGEEENSNDRTSLQHNQNGVTNGSFMNGAGGSRGEEEGDEEEPEDTEMETDAPASKQRQLCGGNQAAIEKMLSYGRELHTMSEKLRQEYGTNEQNKKGLREAFSLLAYADPWNSPVGHQLDPVQREPVCAALNSAILESHGLPKQPPLELAIGQATQCMRLMAKSGVGSCAFASLNDYLH